MTTIRQNRREEQRARTREELLDAAARVFAERGYHAASVDLVADAAGYTKGAVYSNFDSKEDLFLALLDRRIEASIAAMEELLFARAPEDRAQMFAGAEPEVEVVDQDWFLLETEFMLYAARNGDVRERIAARQRLIQDRVTELVGRHLDDLGVAPERLAPERFARILIAVVSGLARASLADPRASDHAGELLNDVANGLIHQATSPPS
ncbi:TetR/AcrR family transcriptional regulator [Egicoccus sp. AB-alg6-2]|uniref:TetR/AcrR family transcriptional regulator n=1 Tax=Egicoccus sp. AB-alg6-2 TaxID=3242692 RepID=UPI00359D2916